MYIRRNLKKLILASVVIGSLTFTPEIYFNDFPITLTAYAEGQTYTGVGINEDELYNQKISEGVKLLEQKDYISALNLYNEAIQINPNAAEAYNGRSYVNWNLKNYNQSIEDATKAIQINPNYAEAYKNRGNSYYDLKNYNQAMTDFNKAIQIDPNYAEAYNSRGVLHNKLKNYKQEI